MDGVCEGFRGQYGRTGESPQAGAILTSHGVLKRRERSEQLNTGSRSAVLRRSEPTRFFVCERRRSRRNPSAIRSERSEQSNTVRMFLDASGRMHAASVVVRCPLTPDDSDSLRSSRARPHRVRWDHPKRGRPTGPVAINTTGVTTHVAVKIRLKRFGKIRSPHYRIVVADSRTKRDGRAIEEIGKYHPKNDPSVIEVNSERAQFWLSVGAQPTEAVVALLKRTGDWQQYSGDASPSGVEPQPEKKNKTDAFNTALAEAGKEPTSAAVTSAKKAAPKSEARAGTTVEGTPAEAQQAADAGVADAEASPASSSGSEQAESGSGANPSSGSGR